MSLNQSLIHDFSEYSRWSQRAKIKYKLHYAAKKARFLNKMWHRGSKTKWDILHFFQNASPLLVALLPV